MNNANCESPERRNRIPPSHHVGANQKRILFNGLCCTHCVPPTTGTDVDESTPTPEEPGDTQLIITRGLASTNSTTGRVAHPAEWPWSSWSHYATGEGLLKMDAV